MQRNKVAPYEAVWPRGRRVAASRQNSRRLSGLEGKTIGELWDWLFRGDEIFPILERSLAERFPGIRFVNYTSLGNTHGGDEKRVIAELPGKLREHGCDAVISAVGC